MLRSAAIVLCLSAAACGPLTSEDQGDDTRAESTTALTLPPGASEQILALVNHPGTDAAVLDGKVGLDVRAVSKLIAHRDGADGQPLTADDDLFDTIAELDAVPYVGDSAFAKLGTYAAAHPAPAAETVEGIAFRGWEAEAVVWGVNTQDAAVLNALIDARAAQALVAGRPFPTVTKMGPVAYVGPAALAKLRSAAKVWWTAKAAGPASLAGTFDGVAFDAATAKTALQLCNSATPTEMLAKGLPPSAAGPIAGNRPYASLAAVAAVSGVGPAAMQALKAWAQVGQGGGVAEARAALEAASAGLYMPSETDAIFVFLAGQQLSGAPITADLVRAQLTAQHDALIASVMYTDPSDRALAAKTLVEEVDATQFFNRLAYDVDPNDPDSIARGQQFAKLKAALDGQLTDLKVYRFGRISISTIIVGRTHDGTLAGLLTGQVET